MKVLTHLKKSNPFDQPKNIFQKFPLEKFPLEKFPLEKFPLKIFLKENLYLRILRVSDNSIFDYKTF